MSLFTKILLAIVARGRCVGFRQDLKILFYKLSGAPIRTKSLEVTPRNIRLDIDDRLENVTDIDRRIFLHQNTASASLTTRSRMAGSSPVTLFVTPGKLGLAS